VIVSVFRSTTPLWTTGEAKFFSAGSAIPGGSSSPDAVIAP
jgi:hypothetical protein